MALVFEAADAPAKAGEGLLPHRMEISRSRMRERTYGPSQPSHDRSSGCCGNTASGSVAPLGAGGAGGETEERSSRSLIGTSIRNAGWIEPAIGKISCERGTFQLTRSIQFDGGQLYDLLTSYRHECVAAHGEKSALELSFPPQRIVQELQYEPARRPKWADSPAYAGSQSSPPCRPPA